MIEANEIDFDFDFVCFRVRRGELYWQRGNVVPVHEQAEEEAQNES
jgi:hypothetical protein